MALYFCLQDKILCVAIVDTIGKAGAEGNQKTWYVPCLASGLLPFFTIFWASSNASWWQKHQKRRKRPSRRRQDCWPFFLWSHLFWSICHLVSQGSCVPSIWDNSCIIKCQQTVMNGANCRSMLCKENFERKRKCECDLANFLWTYGKICGSGGVTRHHIDQDDDVAQWSDHYLATLTKWQLAFLL